MFTQKLKTVLPLATIAFGVLTCVALAAGSNMTSPPPAPIPEPAKSMAQGPNKLLIYRAGYLTLIDPDGRNEKKLTPDQKQFLSGHAKFSPDGKKLAVMVHKNAAAPTQPLVNLSRDRRLHIRDVDEKEPGTDLDVTCDQFAWSPTGTEIVCYDIGAKDSPNFVVDVKTKKKTELKLPKLAQITDWSQDGKYFLTTHHDGYVTSDNWPHSWLCLTSRSGTERKAVTDSKAYAFFMGLIGDVFASKGRKVLTDPKEYGVFGRFSPDNRFVLYQTSSLNLPKGGQKKSTFSIRTLELATGKSQTVVDIPPDGVPTSFCWTPDGRQVAYTWQENHWNEQRQTNRNRETKTHLVVCDLDGSNAKTIATEKGAGVYHITLAVLDSR